MNRFFKILVPVVLMLAVLISIGWYLIEYDPEFTRDVLVSQARKQSDLGNHSLATRLYELAYKHAGNDETVALELAQQFKDVGNYTKAEYTLSHAIADGGSVELYIALCKTYVEQDKLLDAVNMLENITQPQIKEQIEALRPKAPSPDPEQGFYDQYITVSFNPPDGALYVTTDSDWPSTTKDAYTGPITLSSGETTIIALTVAPSGLVSPRTILSYTVTGVIEEVTLTDPAIDRIVREKLAIHADDALSSDQLWTITELKLPADTADLSDLKWFPFLHSLTIPKTALQNLSGLYGMTALQTLTVTDMSVSAEDLAVIAGLPKLTSLTLRNCGLSGITPLSAATGLRYLDLSSNAIRDLTALSAMPELTQVDLSHNALDDLEIFRTMTSLSALNAAYNSITSCESLSGCTGLTSLDLTGNKLTTVTGIERIFELKQLSVAFNDITDVAPLAANTTLEVLDISNNEISDITALGTLNKLTTFNFSYNRISQLPQFSQECALVTIKGSENQLTSLAELAGLPQLNYVIMDGNLDLASIDPLATCEQLVQVSVYETAVTDVSAVTKTATGESTGVKVLYGKTGAVASYAPAPAFYS
ncbi:MAG: leucine-rich repeat domain-containing protein [Oscillospiraceae bacterium]|nr:leucine-rich repeat domain-containing protein [Oscillospiraceae bacterium]